MSERGEPGRVVVERSDGIALVTVESVRTRNALTPAMAAELVMLCDEIDRSDDVGAVVIRGANGTFCSGADTRAWGGEQETDPVSDAAYAQTELMYNSFHRVGQLRVPVVAAVRGAAVGAGCNLALAADLRIVSRTARLIGGFTRIGVHPGGGFFTIASRVGGRELAAALGIFGDEIDGDRAVAAGVAWEAVPDDDVESRALELAGRVASDPPLARRVVRSFRIESDAAVMSWAAAVEVERAPQAWSFRRKFDR